MVCGFRRPDRTGGPASAVYASTYQKPYTINHKHIDRPANTTAILGILHLPAHAGGRGQYGAGPAGHARVDAHGRR